MGDFTKILNRSSSFVVRSSLFFIWFLKVLPSTIMYSFPSNSAISLGGSDSGGSIEQPIMDREVISIGGSSSKDTC